MTDKTAAMSIEALKKKRNELTRMMLEMMPPEERHEIFSKYCRHCGGDRGCQCWNDE